MLDAMRPEKRLAAVLAGALAFGLFAAWAKGPGTDGIGTLSQLRAGIGNVSTPWLLVAFLAGAQARRLRSGAALGLAATAVALVGFYVLTTMLVDLGGHGFFGDLRLELRANRGYFEGGIVCGILFGALGAWWISRRSFSATLLAGALMMAEPAMLMLIGAAGVGVFPATAGVPLVVRMVPGWGLTPSRDALQLGIYAAEFVSGLALVGAAASARLQAAR